MAYGRALSATFVFALLDLGGAFLPNVSGLAVPPSIGHAQSSALSPSRISSLSVPFIQNVGQMSDGVSYYTNTFGCTLFVASDGLTYAVSGKGGQSAYSSVIKETFVDGRMLSPAGLSRSITGVSYFIGADPAGWHSHVPTYDELNLGQVWSGVDVHLRAYGGGVDSIFYVSPRADPNVIRMGFSGVTSISSTEDGDSLLLITEEGSIPVSDLFAYQTVNGLRVPVSVSFVHDSASYGFRVGAYDPSRTLVIDPIIQSTYLGGSSGDDARGIALDSSGNVYITGETLSTNFPGTAGGAQPSFGGLADGFVAKLSGDLKTLIQATYLGGSDLDHASAITLDSSGNVYVTGDTRSKDFPGTAGGAQASNPGNVVAFVAKLPGGLTSITQSTYLGGTTGGDDKAKAIALDSSGNVYVTGETWATDFPNTAGGAQASNAGAPDAFVSKLSDDLKTIMQSTYLGGSNSDGAEAIALDSSGNVYVTGTTFSTNFPGTAGGAQSSFGGGQDDVFVARLSGDLKTLTQATYLGGSNNEDAFGIALDSSANVYIAGRTLSTDLPKTAGGAQASFGGLIDAFVSKLTPDLKTLTQSTYLGGSGADQAFAVALDSSGNVHVAGQTSSTDFPNTAGGAQASNAGQGDAFVSNLSGDLTSITQSTYLGGSKSDQAVGIALDSSGNVYVAGETFSTDFPGTSGGAQSSNGGGGLTDGFVSKLSGDLRLFPFPIVLAPPTATNAVGGSHTVTATVTDFGTPAAGVTVTFTVLSGPNAGKTGTAVTDNNGQASFTYTDTGGAGTDRIQASDATDNSNVVTKMWKLGTTGVPEFGMSATLASAIALLALALLLRTRKATFAQKTTSPSSSR